MYDTIWKCVFKKFKSNDRLRLSIEIWIGKFHVRLIALFQSYYQENFMIELRFEFINYRLLS